MDTSPAVFTRRRTTAVSTATVAIPCGVNGAALSAYDNSDLSGGYDSPAPSSDVDNAIQELYQRSSEGLDDQQSQQLRDLLQQFTDIFAARNQDCTKTNLVQHSIDTGTALPI